MSWYHCSRMWAKILLSPSLVARYHDACSHVSLQKTLLSCIPAVIRPVLSQCRYTLTAMTLLQIPVLVDSITDDGQFLGRTQWDAPDVDPMVFLSEPESNELPALAVGQMRLCEVDGTLLFDIEAHPVR